MANSSPPTTPPQKNRRSGCLAFVAIATALTILLGQYGRDQMGRITARSKAYDLLAAQRTAWNDSDLAKFTATYRMHDDTTLYCDGRVHKGWEQLYERYRTMYAGRPMGELGYDDVTIDIIACDTAVMRGTWIVKSDAGTRTGLFTMLARKFPEGWKIVHDHMTIGELR